MSYLTGLVKRGYTIGMDHMTWGTRGQPGFLSWQQRAESIKKLVDAGFVDKIFLSHDWYFGISIAASGAMDAMDKMNPDGMLLNSRKTIPYLKQLGVSEQQIPGSLWTIHGAFSVNVTIRRGARPSEAQQSGELLQITIDPHIIEWRAPDPVMALIHRTQGG